MVYARSLPGCCFTVICLGSILLCSSLSYMYIIWFMWSTFYDIIMIHKVFVLITLYKKVKIKLIIAKRDQVQSLVFFIEKLTEKRYDPEAHFTFHISVLLEKIWLLKIFDQYLSVLICHFSTVAVKIHCNAELKTIKIIKWMHLIHKCTMNKMNYWVSKPLKIEIKLLKQIWI